MSWYDKFEKWIALGKEKEWLLTRAELLYNTGYITETECTQLLELINI